MVDTGRFWRLCASGMAMTTAASGCGVSFGDAQTTDLDFADDAILAETADILAEVLEILSEEKTKEITEKKKH